MKKAYVLFLVALFISTTTLFAQLSQFKKKQVDIQLGAGILSTLGNTNEYGTGIDTKLKTPPISVTVDVGVTEEISIGGYIGKATSALYYIDISGKYHLGDIHHFLIGVRGLYHFDLSPKFDTYAGAMLAYNAYKVDNTIDESAANVKGFDYNVLIGGRYRFAPHTGVFVEVGYGVAIVNLGLNLKF